MSPKEVVNYHKMSDIEKIQDILRRLDNGWNSGSVFEIERMLGELLPEYSDLQNQQSEDQK